MRGNPHVRFLGGEWRSDALFLPDRPNGNGGAQASDAQAMPDAANGGAPADLDDEIPF